MPAAAPLLGLWKRQLLSVNGGQPFEDSDAYWLQGDTAFVDVRIPLTTGSPTCFAGRTQHTDRRLYFHHDIDLAASIVEDWADIEWRDPDTLVERGSIQLAGRAIEFEEVWLRQKVAIGPVRNWQRYKQGCDHFPVGLALMVGDAFAMVDNGQDTGQGFSAALFVKHDGHWQRLAALRDAGAGASSVREASVNVDDPEQAVSGWQSMPSS